MSPTVDCKQGEGSSWEFMSQLKVTGKSCTSVMKLHLATVNTGQLMPQFNQIYSKISILPHKHGDRSEQCRIHQTGLLQSAANRQRWIKWYLLWHAVFPTDSFAVWQQNRNREMHKPTQRVREQHYFLNSAVKTVLFLKIQKEARWEFTLFFCYMGRWWYYFIMTEPIFYSYQGLSAFPPCFTHRRQANSRLTPIQVNLKVPIAVVNLNVLKCSASFTF